MQNSKLVLSWGAWWPIHCLTGLGASEAFLSSRFLRSSEVSFKRSPMAASCASILEGRFPRWSYCLVRKSDRYRFVEGLGLGGATMLAPTYVAENAPRGIRGLLVGFYHLFETMGAMVAFFINYGSLLHLKGHATWIVPLSMQSLPPLLLFCSIFFCPESPRWLASKDNWDKASSTLSTVRRLPASHPYVQAELLEMKTQLDAERGRAGGNSYWALTKEAWTIPGNRRRCIMVIVLMIAQQMTGTVSVVHCERGHYSSTGLLLSPLVLFVQLSHNVSTERYQLLCPNHLHE